MNMNYVFLGIGVVVLLYLYTLYVSLVKKRNKLKEASSDVDVQLNKRYDLIPNILNMASKFMEHEKMLFAEIVRLRSEAMSQKFEVSPSERMKIEDMLDAKLKTFWLNVENYPELKSNQTMQQAMQTFEDAEEHIAAARRFYNTALRDLCDSVEIFPSSMVAKLVGIKVDKAFFKAPEAAVERIDAKDYFK